MPVKVKDESEKEWLRSVVVPKMLKNGAFNKNGGNGVNGVKGVNEVKGVKGVNGVNGVNEVNGHGNFDDLEIFEISITFIGADEAYMLTICYRATIEYQFQGHRDKRQIVVKKTPKIPEKLYAEVNFETLFGNEILTFTKLKPAIEQFTQQTLEVPRYIYSDLQPNSASIVLEDFGAKGWRVTKDRYNLCLEHILVAAKYLGDFHGIGFAMREVKRKEFDGIVNQLKESRYAARISGYFLLQLEISVKRLVKVTRQYEPSVDEGFLNKLETLLSDYYTYGKQTIAPVEPFVTLCHGDFLRNNIAFRYAVKEGGIEVPIDAMMFDLQTMRLSSPMLDLNNLLTISTFAGIRHPNFKLIFETYRKQLIETYEMHTRKTAPAFFDYNSLIKDYIRLMPYGSFIAAFFLMNIVEPPQANPEDYMTRQETLEAVIHDSMTRGGETIDRELSHQVREMYDLSLEHGVDIAQGFDLENM